MAKMMRCHRHDYSTLCKTPYYKETHSVDPQLLALKANEVLEKDL